MKKNSFVHEALKPNVIDIGNIIKTVDVVHDSSHGILLTAAIAQENTEGIGLDATCEMWGHPDRITELIYAASKSDEQFCAIIRKVAIRIATDKLSEQNAKTMHKIAKKPTIILPADWKKGNTKN